MSHIRITPNAGTPCEMSVANKVIPLLPAANRGENGRHVGN